jgi:quercetin dioxygenase-like cupin family protein
MNTRPFALGLLVAAMLASPTVEVQAQAQTEVRETVVPAYAYPIANVPGKTVTALIVSYPPGAQTPPHRHGQAFVVGYVLEGAIRSQVDNGEIKVYKAGESWTEKPGAHHRVSGNASSTEPARLFAILIADSKAKDLFTVDPAPKK